MINLYIDFDGVVLDTISITFEQMKTEGIDLKDFVRVKEFYQNVDWSHLLSTAEVINDSIDNIQKIIDTGKYDVSILTHVNSLTEAVEKVRYIRQYFKDITVIPVPKEISKTKMVQTKGSILVDDYAGNLREWESEEGIAVRFSKTLNSKGFKVVDRLDKLIDMFADLTV